MKQNRAQKQILINTDLGPGAKAIQKAKAISSINGAGTTGYSHTPFLPPKKNDFRQRPCILHQH